MIHLLRRRLEEHRAKGKHDQEASIGLDVSAFIGTANLFFTGLVILNLGSLPSVVHVSVVYLVISAVAFMVSAVIYANVVGSYERSAFREQMVQTANWISEYPGVYLFMSAIPVLILGVTDVLLIQITTAVACYGALILYSASSFSIDHRRFKGGIDRVINTTILAVFTIGTYISAFLFPQYLLYIGIGAIIVLLASSYFSFSFDISNK
jgi:hypothetical protein